MAKKLLSSITLLWLLSTPYSIQAGPLTVVEPVVADEQHHHSHGEETPTEDASADNNESSPKKSIKKVGQIHILAHDSIAGIGTDIEIRNLGGDATLSILPPYGEEIIYEVAANDKLVHLPGSDLEHAGVYEVTLERGGAIAQSTSAFTVLPDSVDPNSSTIQVDRTTVNPNGVDEVLVTVILRDRFGNVLPERPVRLISSRSSDYIEEVHSETDVSGQQMFHVAAVEAGLMSLRAMDLLSGKMLDAQLTITAGAAVGGALPGTQTAYVPTAQPTYVPVPQPQYVPVPAAQYVPNVQYVPAGYAPNPYAANISNVLPYRAQIGSSDIIDHFTIEVPNSIPVDTFENMSITAVDENGTVVEGYVGTVALSVSPSSNEVDLPGFGFVEFKPADLGSKTLSLGLRFRDPGEQVLIVEDSQDPSVNSQVTINVIDTRQPAAEDQLIITSPQPDDSIGSTTVTVTGQGPQLANLEITGGQLPIASETDDAGFFTVDVLLDPTVTTHTITVTNMENENNVADVTFTLDLQGPEIVKLSFDPEDPFAKEDFLVQAQIDASPEQIETVKLTIGDLTYALKPNETDPQVYETILNIEEIGTYEPIVQVTDINQQSDEFIGEITITEQPLPQVQNVVVTPLSKAATVTWNTVSDSRITAYHIFIQRLKNDGTIDENNFDNFETEGLTNTVTLAGLTPGASYFFAVSAVAGEVLGPESDVVRASILGLTLEVTPGDSLLNITWEPLLGDTPPPEYILEYTADLAELEQETAMRLTINGTANGHLLTDLINGLPYYVRLTPVVPNGSDFAATGQGTPNGNGFSMSPVDSIPPDTHGSAPAFPPHAGQPGSLRTPPPNPQPPQLSAEGLPFSPWWLVAILCVCTGVFLHHRRQSVRINHAFMQHMQSQYEHTKSSDHPLQL